MILDATAGERERQSLEPLLATPAPRSAIVSGKIAAACVIGMVSLLLTLLAFKLSAQLSTSNLGRQLNVGFVPMLQMLFILVPMLFVGTSLLTLSGRRRQEHEGSAGAHDLVAAAADAAGLCLDGVSAEDAAVAFLRCRFWRRTRCC